MAKDSKTTGQDTRQPAKEHPPTPYPSADDLRVRLEHAGLVGR